MNQGVNIERVGAALGAVLSGIDLRDDLSDAAESVLRDALAEHEVIFLRDQQITAERQLEVAEIFGTPSLYPISKLFGATEPECSVIEDTADSPPTTDNWHTDVTWIESPPVAALLTALVVPPVGGNTMWASTTAAYDALSDAMKERLDGLEVLHSNWPGFCETAERKSGVEGLGQKIREQYPEVVHPLVRTHPVTGRRSLYINASDGGSSTGVMKTIVGMNPGESSAILGFLAEHINQPKFHCRWAWTQYDLAIWDERVTNHRGVADHHPEHRVVRRCTVDGERPYFDPEVRPSAYSANAR